MTLIRAKVSDRSVIGIQVEDYPDGKRRPEEKDVSGKAAPDKVVYDFRTVIPAIEDLAESVHSAFKKLSPKKGTVEIGLELAVESGALTAILVKGSGKANLKITLEW
jgi:hypothetical protein